MLRRLDVLLLLFCFFFLQTGPLAVEAKKNKRKKRKKKKKIADDDWIDREYDKPDRDGLTDPTHLLIIENHTEDTLQISMLIPIYDTPDGEPGFGHKNVGQLNPYEKKVEKTYAGHEYLFRNEDKKLVQQYKITEVPLEQYVNIKLKEKTEL